jgi:hypothetical protein
VLVESADNFDTPHEYILLELKTSLQVADGMEGRKRPASGKKEPDSTLSINM